MAIEKTILAFNGTFLEPKKGLEIKNAESLIEFKKNKNRCSIKKFSSSAGNASRGA